MSQRIDALEQQLKIMMGDLENLNKNTKQSGEKSDIKHEDLKIESVGHMESHHAGLSVGFAAQKSIESDFIVSGKDIKF